MGIENITDWSKRQKLDVVVKLLSNLHEQSYEDMRWGEKHLGMTYGDMIGLFIDDAKRLYLLRDPDGEPLYLMAFGPTGYFSTLSRADRDDYRLYLTKHMIRYAKSDRGRRELQGTYGAMDVEDVRQGTFTYLWIYAMGYDFCDEVVLPTGPTIQRFAYNIPPPDDDFIGENDDVRSPQTNPATAPAPSAESAYAG